MYHIVRFSARSSKKKNKSRILLSLATQPRIKLLDGWARDAGDLIEGMILCLKRDIFSSKVLIRNAVGKKVNFEIVRSVGPTEAAPFLKGFHFLPSVNRRRKWRRSPIIVLDYIDHRGTLVGWGYNPRLPEMKVRVNICMDGRKIGKAVASVFHRNLLYTGIGYGEHGFTFRIPDHILDGRSHKFYLEAETPDGKVLGRSQISEISLPRSFKVNSFWRNRSDLTGINAIRQRIIDNGVESELGDLLSEWDQHPETVFVDVGMAEHHRQTERVFLSFRERLAHRLASPNCPKIIRSFNSKSFTKQYCEQQGIRTAETYLISRNYEEILDFNFPSRFILKPTIGSGKCTFLFDSGFDLLSWTELELSQILSSVKKYMELQPNSEFIIEELFEQKGANGSVIPLDYKFHVFGGKVRIIQVDDRNVFDSRDRFYRNQGWFSKNWTPSPFCFRFKPPQAVDFIQPDQFLEMIDLAENVGTVCEDYVRVDMYDSEGGIALGEVTIFSHGGHGFTDFGDLILSQAWHASVLASLDKRFLAWV